jgi:glycosyltransferase involved in cell wall biosynthesis
MVSVIIPSYNREYTLGYCINSILSQTYRNLEILLLVQEPRDKIQEICENYEKLDERVRIIKEKGMSEQHRTEVYGDYLIILRPDIYAVPEMIETLVEKSEEFDADMVYCEKSRIIWKVGKFIKQEQSLSMPAKKMTFYYREQFLCMVPDIFKNLELLLEDGNCIYRLREENKNYLNLVPNLGNNEREEFKISYYRKAEKTVFLPQVLCYQIGNEGSTTDSEIRYREYWEQIRFLEAFRRMIQKENLWEEAQKSRLYNYVAEKTVYYIQSLYDEGMGCSDKKARRTLTEICRNSFIKKSLLAREGNETVKFRKIKRDILGCNINKILKHLKIMRQQNGLADGTLRSGRFNQVMVRILILISRPGESTKLDALIGYLQTKGIRAVVRKLVCKR